MAGAIGVLLPIRIETVFDQPGDWGGQWRLRVLLIPDAPSLDRHTGARRAELDLLRTMWTTCLGDVTTPQGQNAFAQLAEALGPARAAWLLRAFPPKRDGAGALWLDAAGHVVLNETAAVQDEPSVSTIRGVPRKIELWFARGNDAPLERLAQLAVDAGPLAPDAFDLDEPHWMWNWEKAEEVGLGATVNLFTAGVNHPSEIAVLIAVGLGDEGALELFQHHRDSGSLSFIKPGSPTNSVAGAPTVDWGGDSRAWLERARNPSSTRACQELADVFGGGQDDLAGTPDPSGAHQRLNQSIVQSLWYALWGHGLKDVWGVKGTHVAGTWAGQHLFPEGPLPPIRVGDQPYGILPATSLARWTKDPADPNTTFADLETAISPSLIELRRAFASAARSAGTVDGASTERLLDLIARTPYTVAFAYRAFLPLQTFWTLLKLFGSTQTLAEVVDWWEHHASAVLKLAVSPPRAYATMGWPADLRLPLVDPHEPPFRRALEELLAELEQRGPEAFARHYLERPLPNSLLLRLWIYSVLTADAELTRAAAGNVDPIVEPIVSSDPQTELWKAVFAKDPSIVNDPAVQGRPQLALYRAVQNVRYLVKEETADIERVFSAALDCAGHRVDPWVTGIAWRRLRYLRAAGAESTLGVYGWVDRPFTGTRGPTAGGLLHAPAHAQGLTSVILRDKAIHDLQVDRWKMNLSSSTARLVKQLADHVREGSHLAEALGREVERIAGDRDLIAHLRRSYPVRVEHEGRRVCDGLKILAEPVSAKLQLNARQLEELNHLRAAVDAYGDMLVADGVFHLVTGKADLAGKTMDAAAGLALPPEIEFLKTRRQGWAVTTTVVQVLREGATPNALAAGVSPGALAEPALAALLVERFGGAAHPNWTWRFERAHVVREVLLTETHLDPIDVLALDLDALEFLLREQLPDRGEGWQLKDARGRSTRDRARGVVNALARQPALFRDLFPDAQPAERENVDIADQNLTLELRTRYLALLGAAKLLAAQVEALIAIGAGGDEASQRSCLRHLSRWGIVPAPQEGESALDRLTRAQESLVIRLGNAPDAPGAASLNASDLASAIAELAAPGGRLRVLSRMPLQALRDRGLAAAPDFRRLWLEMIAAVRAPLARVESVTLAEEIHGSLFDLYADHPSDPWQQQVIQQNEQRAALGQDTPAPPPLSVAFAASGVLGAGEAGDQLVAVGLVDGWGETVPRTQHHTTAAFGFNAPAARAPQAVLIAVPPRTDVALDAATLADIVMETRALAHARMVAPEDVGAFAQALPLTFLSAAGNTGVSLEVKP